MILALLALLGTAEAAPAPAPARPAPVKKGAGKKKGPVEVPVDIGVGPAAHLLTGPVFREQPILGGIEFSAEAVLDHKTLVKLKNRIPSQYRKQALSMDEIRISHPLIPHTIFLSPAGVGGATVGMYGISFRPIAIGIPLISEPFRFELDLGVRLTYAYLHSTEIPSPTHFLRPGLDPKAEIELPFSDRFLVSFGWCSQLYIPQTVGGGVFEAGPLDEDIWHVGQGFFKLHFRVPVKVAR
ncbi:MAG: hypothetical protein H6738_01530 [Alphaproteobacteria bacterium]|nr:hypothetical protein [Alphaproteobacteria bacterium]MCB9695449.1 hypothetical protein [Alphaproteobacteria bacterium]